MPNAIIQESFQNKCSIKEENIDSISINKMKKLKVLHIGNVDSFKNNYICQYLIDQGHEVHFIGRREPNKPVKGIHYHIIETNILRIPKVKLLELILRTRKIINKVQPDILHTHNAGNPAWLARFSGFHPYVIQCFGGDLFEERNRYYRWMIRSSLQKADQLIVTGKHMVDTLEQVFNVNRSKVEVLPRGLDLSVFRPFDNKETFRKKYKLKSGPIIFSPRYLLDHVYNIEVIVRSAPLVKKLFPEVQYIQLLKQPEDRKVYDYYIDLIERLGIKGDFVFMPVVENREMPEFYNAADLCISIPNYDGFPVSVLEGSACGIPFIVSDVPYTREWFENGKNGIVLQEISPGVLADATIELLKDEARRKQMAVINREKVQKGFNYHHCMEKLEQLYLRLIT